MGRALGAHAVEKSHQVVGFDSDAAAARRAAGEGIDAATSVDDLLGWLPAPRAVVLYLPHGTVTEETCRLLARKLAAAT